MGEDRYGMGSRLALAAAKSTERSRAGRVAGPRGRARSLGSALAGFVLGTGSIGAVRVVLQEKRSFQRDVGTLQVL